jgi:hypothetical protein
LLTFMRVRSEFAKGIDKPIVVRKRNAYRL